MVRKSRLSWYKQSCLIELLVAGLMARIAAHLVNVNKYYLPLIELIYNHCEVLKMFDGEIVVYESYFCVRRKISVVS